jgi:hypothetical protein
MALTITGWINGKRRRFKYVNGKKVDLGPATAHKRGKKSPRKPRFEILGPPGELAKLPGNPAWTLIDDTFIRACERGDKSKICEMLCDPSYVLTHWDRRFLAAFHEGRFRKGPGRPRTSNIPVALMMRETFVKPFLQKELKEQQRARRKQGLPYGIEDVITQQTVDIMRWEGEIMKWEGMPVSFEALKAAYHNQSKFKKNDAEKAPILPNNLG